jgi:hypothetical protein
MALTKDHYHYDHANNYVTIEVSFGGEGTVAYVAPSDDGVYVTPKSSAPLALNMLGHDVEEEDRHAISVNVEDAVVQIAQTPLSRDFQLRHAAALLKAVIAFDNRAERLAAAEKRREQALESLANSFARVNKPATEWTGADVGKLREALGRYDAALAN